MSSSPRSTIRQLAPYAAYAAAVFFALHLLSYFIPAFRDATITNSLGIAVALAALAIAQHLAVFPVVYALSAPVWAQIAAYTWLVVDMITDLMQLADAPKSLYLPLRLAVNALAALWIAAASWRMSGATRVIGVVVAISTALYSAVGLLSPRAFVVTLPALVLLPLWFLLVGRRLAYLPSET